MYVKYPATAAHTEYSTNASYQLDSWNMLIFTHSNMNQEVGVLCGLEFSMTFPQFPQTELRVKVTAFPILFI